MDFRAQRGEPDLTHARLASLSSLFLAPQHLSRALEILLELNFLILRQQSSADLILLQRYLRVCDEIFIRILFEWPFTQSHLALAAIEAMRP
jgi:hypothetical protein